MIKVLHTFYEHWSCCHIDPNSKEYEESIKQAVGGFLEDFHGMYIDIDDIHGESYYMYHWNDTTMKVTECGEHIRIDVVDEDYNHTEPKY